MRPWLRFHLILCGHLSNRRRRRSAVQTIRGQRMHNEMDNPPCTRELEEERARTRRVVAARGRRHDSRGRPRDRHRRARGASWMATRRRALETGPNRRRSSSELALRLHVVPGPASDAMSSLLAPNSIAAAASAMRSPARGPMMWTPSTRGHSPTAHVPTGVGNRPRQLVSACARAAYPWASL